MCYNGSTFKERGTQMKTSTIRKISNATKFLTYRETQAMVKRHATLYGVTLLEAQAFVALVWGVQS
jgi:hypothetical protein